MADTERRLWDFRDKATMECKMEELDRRTKKAEFMVVKNMHATEWRQQNQADTESYISKSNEES